MCGCFCSRTFCNIFKKPLDNCGFLVYNGKAVKNAAIAQSVERILGKDEVASSNLASSSKKKPGIPTDFRLSSFLCYMVPTPKTDTETDTATFLYLLFIEQTHCEACFLHRGSFVILLL